MANPGYVRSTTGSDAHNGSTWALANATLAGAMADQVAGDRIWVSQAHAEIAVSAVTINLPGTVASPNQLLCGEDAAEPPTTLAASASLTVNGGFGLNIEGNCYVRGIIFAQNATGGSTKAISLATSGSSRRQTYEACEFRCDGLSSFTGLHIGAPNGDQGALVVLVDSRFRFGNADSSLIVAGQCLIEGGGLRVGGVVPNRLCTLGSNGRSADLSVVGCDLHALGTATQLLNGTVGGNAPRARFVRCLLPLGWTGTPWSVQPVGPARAELYDCQAGDQRIRLWIADWLGSVRDETTLIRSGGGDLDGTPIAFRMTSGNTRYPLLPLVGQDMVIANSTIGSPRTLAIEILHDSLTDLTNADIALEVEFLGATTRLSHRARNAPMTVIAAAAAHPSSAASWTTTGMTNPRRQRLQITFTPQSIGPVKARLLLFRPNTTVFIDPPTAGSLT